MTRTTRIAALIGPTLVVLSVSEAINLDIWKRNNAAVTYLNGLLFFVAGLAIVRTHNRWVRAWPVLITITGWFAIALGLFRMFLPKAQQGADNVPTYAVIAGVLAMGIFLTVKAYRPSGEPRRRAPGASVLDRLGATRLGVWVIGHVVSPLQRRLLLATGGRVSLTGKLPVLLLTATGRRSGRPRTVPLIFLRDGDDLVVCNVRPPSERPNPWPLNVRANANVSVQIRGVTEQRVAREAGAREAENYWPLLVKTWPAYERFFANTNERSIFVLQRP